MHRHVVPGKARICQPVESSYQLQSVHAVLVIKSKHVQKHGSPEAVITLAERVLHSDKSTRNYRCETDSGVTNPFMRHTKNLQAVGRCFDDVAGTYVVAISIED